MFTNHNFQHGFNHSAQDGHCKLFILLCLTETPSIPSYSLLTCSASPPESLFCYKIFKADNLVLDLVTHSWVFCLKRMSFVTGSSQVCQSLLNFGFCADSSILQIYQSTLRCHPPSPFTCKADVSPCSLNAFNTCVCYISLHSCTHCIFIQIFTASGCTRGEEGHPHDYILGPTVNFLPKSHRCSSHLGLSVTS